MTCQARWDQEPATIDGAVVGWRIRYHLNGQRTCEASSAVSFGLDGALIPLCGFHRTPYVYVRMWRPSTENPLSPRVAGVRHATAQTLGRWFEAWEPSDCCLDITTECYGDLTRRVEELVTMALPEEVNPQEMLRRDMERRI